MLHLYDHRLEFLKTTFNQAFQSDLLSCCLHCDGVQLALAFLVDTFHSNNLWISRKRPENLWWKICWWKALEGTKSNCWGLSWARIALWQWAKQGSSRQYPLLLYMFCFHLLYISMYVRTYETFQHWRIQTRDCPKFSIGYFCFLPQNRRPRPRLAWSGCADICKMQIQHQQLIARILQGDMLHSSWSIMSPRFQRIIQIFKAYVYQHRHIQIIDSDTISESNRIRQLNLVLLPSGSNIYPEIPCTASYSIRSGLKSIEFDVFTFRKCWNPLHQINSTTLQKPNNLRVFLWFWSVTGINIIYHPGN